MIVKSFVVCHIIYSFIFSKIEYSVNFNLFLCDFTSLRTNTAYDLRKYVSKLYLKWNSQDLSESTETCQLNLMLPCRYFHVCIFCILMSYECNAM